MSHPLLVLLRSAPAVMLLALLSAAPGSAAPTRHPAPARAAKSTSVSEALPLDKTVAAHQAAARKLAAKARWDAALLELGTAQREIRQANRAASPPRKPSAAYQRETRALRQRLLQQRRLAAQGKADLRRALAEYAAGQKALRGKYGMEAKPARDRTPAEKAHFLLLGAALSDQTADYFARSGNRQQAQKVREDALRDRLLAYRMLGKDAQATAMADKLLALNPSRPDLFSVVGNYYEDRKRYDRAQAVWQRLARLLETGRPTGIGSGSTGSIRQSVYRQLGLCYRQLAYCQSRLGKKTDAAGTLRKAAEAEGRATAPAH